MRKDTENLSREELVEKSQVCIARPRDPNRPRSTRKRMIKKDQIAIETEDDLLVDCALQWFNHNDSEAMHDTSPRPVEVKQEPADETEAPDLESLNPFAPVPEAEEDTTKEEQAGASSSEEEVSQTAEVEIKVKEECSMEVEESSKEAELKKDDDMQPQVGHSEESEKPTKVEDNTYAGFDITGNEDDSVLRRLKHCFVNPNCAIWCGFYNQGFAAYPTHKHQMWHKKFRTTDMQHPHAKHAESEGNLMTEYILRHFNEDVITTLKELSTNTCFECNDPRLYTKIEWQMDRKSDRAETVLREEFENLQKEVREYIQKHQEIPYCVICRIMARAFLGGGILKERDEAYPFRSSAAISVMFWNAGNWCRKGFASTPLPEQLKKFERHIKRNLDEFHQDIPREESQYNNYFINVIKNLAAHVFLNCEATTVYPYKHLLEQQGWTICFNDYHDLMCCARVGKSGYVKRIGGFHYDPIDAKVRNVSYAIFEICFGRTRDESTQYETMLNRARMNTIRVCIYHVQNALVSKSPAVTGEVFATMCWECMYFQTDIICGDGNKAAYYPTPKTPGVPTYEGGLVQWWIDRMVNTATQSRLKNFDPDAVPVRAKHFVASPYTDLYFLRQTLGRVTTDKYTDELAADTQKGDCCIMSIIEWGHSRPDLLEENIEQYDRDEEWMNHVGEFEFDVNEICLHADHNIFNLTKKDHDSHYPILVHLKPAWMTNQEKNSYLSSEYKQNKSQSRKERQRDNKRKGYQGDSGASSSTQHRRVYG